MLIEQAVFTSARTDRAEGYQLVARSPGVVEEDAREISVWCPSHDSLFEDGADADAIQARNVLTELASMIATGFLTEADSLFALPRGGATTAYDAQGGVLAEITIGSGEGERWARAAGDSITYRLSAFRVGRIAPTLDAVTPGG